MNRYGAAPVTDRTSAMQKDAVMSRLIYLINPAADAPSYWTSEVFGGWGFKPAVPVGDLAIATVAAFAPADFEVRLCDEGISPVDYDIDADFVGITGKVSQWQRMKAVAQEFRRRGKTVIIGGPYASLSPEVARPHCDILVEGEIEDIAEGFFADLRSGQWKSSYKGTKPDIRKSPLPRWDLYPNARAITATVQTSRGCPFECDFCDVIEYLGRKQRHKEVPQVLAELDQLYELGYRTVYLADDNFTVYRARAKELLAALHKWNAAHTDGTMQFSTQVSIDCVNDHEMLRMCADAGFVSVFVGIETPNEESLRGAKKRQNLKRNLVDDLQLFADHGIGVTAGMIAGFDGDGPNIFSVQHNFAMATAVPVFSVGALVAPDATPLRKRLAAEQRLYQDVAADGAGSPFSTNIIPKQMSREHLLNGLKWLFWELYKPSAFEERLSRYIDTSGSAYETHAVRPNSQLRPIETEGLELAWRVGELGSAEARMLSNLLEKVQKKPAAFQHVIGSLVMYAQVRFMFEGIRNKQASEPFALGGAQVQMPAGHPEHAAAS
jgi:radical SAM superfamily enzyme YgiQ (UPF0313 family)